MAEKMDLSRMQKVGFDKSISQTDSAPQSREQVMNVQAGREMNEPMQSMNCKVGTREAAVPPPKGK